MNSIWEAIRAVDISIYRFISGFAGNWITDRLASQEEANNLLKGGVFLAMYWYLWFCGDAERARRRKTILAILLGTVLSVIVARTIAFLAPFRIRPMFDPGLAHPAYSIPITGDLENWSAFPSDTAAYFFGLGFGLAYLVRRHAIPILVYTAGWICLPRLYLGIHYASDLVIGAGIGVTTVWLCIRSDRIRSILAERALRAEEVRPQWFYSAAFLLCFELATVFNECRLVGRALLHATLASVGRGSTHSHVRTPIEEWGGFVATTLLALVTIGLMRLYRSRQTARPFRRLHTTHHTHN